MLSADAEYRPMNRSKVVASGLLALTVGLGTGCSSDQPSVAPARSNAAGTLGTTAHPNAPSTSAAQRAVTTTKSNGSVSTSTTPAVQITTEPTFAPIPRPRTTQETSAPVPGVCTASDADLAQAFETYSRNRRPTVPVVVNGIRHSAVDASWATATVALASDDSIGGSRGIAQCVGVQWIVVDVGTGIIGCKALMPAAVKKELTPSCV